MTTYILALVCAAVCLVADQLTKVYIVNNVALYSQNVFLDGLLNITYVQNGGGAWGILSGRTMFLVVVTVAIMFVCIYLLVVKAKNQPLYFWAVCLVLAGGLGNMIDRLFRGGLVVDFLQFDFWQDFPVFNIADCAIVIGCGLLILHFILDWIREKREKKVATNANNNA
ncbi:MAG: signal peptidase II [Clostridia bacterium]|nr:signal peptidase II [Clostridia bacterium]